MPYSPCFRRVACCNLCVWQPRTKGQSWHRSIYMWKQYLHYRGHKISGRWGKKRHGKMKFFQGLPYNSPVFTKTVITLSFGVRFGPTSTQNARSERANPEKTPSLHQEARSTLKFGLKQDFLALESQRTSFAAVFWTSFWTHWHFLLKEIREITLIIDISPPGRDKHSFLQMLHDPGNPIWP